MKRSHTCGARASLHGPARGARSPAEDPARSLPWGVRAALIVAGAGHAETAGARLLVEGCRARTRTCVARVLLLDQRDCGENAITRSLRVGVGCTGATLPHIGDRCASGSARAKTAT